MALGAKGIRETQLTERAEELWRFRVPLLVDKQKVCDLSPTASSWQDVLQLTTWAFKFVHITE